MPLPTLIPSEPVWLIDDEATLRQLIITPFGQRLLQKLIYQRPVVSSTERDVRQIQSDERAGYEACISDLMRLAEPRPLPPEEV